MSEIRVNFLNWRPDQEPSTHEGLHVADNLIHDTEGYKQVRLADTAATLASFASPVALVEVQTRPAGAILDASGENKMHCRLVNNPGVVTSLQIRPPSGEAAAATSISMTDSGGATTPAATNMCIRAFQVAELNDYVFVTAEATADAASGTALSANITAYMAIDI